MEPSMLKVNHLKTQFKTEDGTLLAVDDVSFHVQSGRTLGIVGESGCGKSVTSLSIMRLILKPGEIVGGEILFSGQDLLKMSDAEIRSIRGNKIAMIFQEPMSSLNPVFTCGEQIEEVIRLHQKNLSTTEIKNATLEML
ncbi:MAG: peptide ABC transporter ATP-binding protein, partial [Bdellovibrio sp. CG10_big_fil_rev_8_21_14_0_10_47_8]